MSREAFVVAITAFILVFVLFTPYALRIGINVGKVRLLREYEAALDAAIAKGTVDASQRQQMIEEYKRDVWGAIK